MLGGSTELCVHVRPVGGRSYDGDRDFRALDQIALARKQVSSPSYNVAIYGFKPDVSSAPRKNQEHHLGIRGTWVPQQKHLHDAGPRTQRNDCVSSRWRLN